MGINRPNPHRLWVATQTDTKVFCYGHRPPIIKTIQIRRTRHAGHCWRSRGELISDVLLWTPTYGRAKAGLSARTYIQQLCKDTGCSPEDLPEAMNDREKWRERARDICACGTTWWWWWGCIRGSPSFVINDCLRRGKKQWRKRLIMGWLYYFQIMNVSVFVVTSTSKCIRNGVIFWDNASCSVVFKRI